jgi:hypothetical protein
MSPILLFQLGLEVCVVVYTVLTREGGTNSKDEHMDSVYIFVYCIQYSTYKITIYLGHEKLKGKLRENLKIAVHICDVCI